MKMEHLFSAIFAVLTGSGMLGLWVFLYWQKQIPELKTEPLRIGFHLAAEMITAILLILSGIALFLGWKITAWLHPLSTGMLLYTAIVSPGYYAQKGQWAFVWMFAAIILASLVSLIFFI